MKRKGFILMEVLLALLLLSALAAAVFPILGQTAGAWHIETDCLPYTRRRAEQTGRSPL